MIFFTFSNIGVCGGSLQFDISPRHVSVTGFNNVSFKCLVEGRPDSCFSNNEFQWRFLDRPLKSGEKYEIQERKTKTKCKTDFIITIFNVTQADEGKYKCTSFCEKNYPTFNRVSTIQLMVFPLPGGSPAGSPAGMNNCVIISSAFSKDVRGGEIFRYKEEGGKMDKF